MRTGLMISLVGALALAACSEAPTSGNGDAPAATATEADGVALLKTYADTVNGNQVEPLMALVTDDVVLQAPGFPEVVGKAAAREFATGYFAGFTSAWEKTQQDFVVAGDVAYSRYTYRVTDTSKADGTVHSDTGKGLLIYRRDADGRWLVARDGWSSDQTPPAN